MAFSGFSRLVELRAGGVEDPDASLTAAAVGAYFDAEWARARRQRVCRAVAVAGLGGWALAVSTSALTPVDLVFGASLLGAAAVTSAVAEWRARASLGKIIARR